jgi:hypothetical protein
VDVAQLAAPVADRLRDDDRVEDALPDQVEQLGLVVRLPRPQGREMIFLPRSARA